MSLVIYYLSNNSNIISGWATIHQSLKTGVYGIFDRGRRSGP